MAVQVGAFCYADAQAAAAAACAQTLPSTTFDAGYTATTSCSGITEGGELVIQTALAPAGGSSAPPSVSTANMPVGFGECTWPDVVTAAEVVIGLALGLWAIWWGGKKLIDLLNWGSGWKES